MEILLSPFIDASKKKHLFRAKQSAVKKKIDSILQEYCMLFEPDKIEEVQSICGKGNFPWMEPNTIQDGGSVTGRQPMSVVNIVCVVIFLTISFQNK